MRCAGTIRWRSASVGCRVGVVLMRASLWAQERHRVHSRGTCLKPYQRAPTPRPHRWSGPLTCVYTQARHSPTILVTFSGLTRKKPAGPFDYRPAGCVLVLLVFVCVVFLL